MISALCYLASVLCAVLAAFQVHYATTLPLAVAFLAAGLLLSTVRDNAASIVGGIHR